MRARQLGIPGFKGETWDTRLCVRSDILLNQVESCQRLRYEHCWFQSWWLGAVLTKTGWPQ